MQIAFGAKPQRMYVGMRYDLMDLSTLKFYREYTISALLEGTRMSWEEMQVYGWKIPALTPKIRRQKF